MDATSGKHHAARIRRARTILPLGVLALVCIVVGCSEGDDATGTEPSPSSSSSPTRSTAEPSVSSSPSPSPTFSDQELTLYEAALARWQEYSEKSAQIYRSGRDTEAARAVFREYDMQAPARIKSLAETYDAGGLRTVQGPVPLSTTPVSITSQVVVLSQCNDYSDIEVTKNGVPVDGVKPKNLQTPIEIEMDRPDGRDWMVARVQLKDKTTCAA